MLSISTRMTNDGARTRLLDAALTVFLRYGFRKTSMDEVARAAHVSRQGLYLHVRTKEELFRATVQHLLSSALEAAGHSLMDEARPLPERLVGAFDAVVGRFVGMFGGEAGDLAEASSTLVGELIREHESEVTEQVAKLLRNAGVAAAYKAVGLNARQLADTLYATARGLKHSCASRHDFNERMGVAARALCAPVGKVP